MSETTSDVLNPGYVQVGKADVPGRFRTRPAAPKEEAKEAKPKPAPKAKPRTKSEPVVKEPEKEPVKELPKGDD